MKKSDAVLILTTMIGSSTVIFGEELLKTTPPFSVLAIRFLIAALLLAIIKSRTIFPLTKYSCLGGLCVGVSFGVGCTLLYYGLPHLHSGKANFLITLEVIIVPILVFIWARKIPVKRELLAIPIAFLGLFLLTWGNNGTLGFYDLLVLGSAVSYALYAIALSFFSPKGNTSQITFIALTIIGVIAAICTLINGNPILSSIDTKWILIMSYLVIIGSIARFLLQSWAQKTASSTHTALIFTLEPVMTAVMSGIFMGEILSTRQLVGGALILASAVITTIK